jgi:hypothetical protein
LERLIGRDDVVEEIEDSVIDPDDRVIDRYDAVRQFHEAVIPTDDRIIDVAEKNENRHRPMRKPVDDPTGIFTPVVMSAPPY